MANLSGSVIELSNYLEQKISQKSAEYAAVSSSLFFLSSPRPMIIICIFYLVYSPLYLLMKGVRWYRLVMVSPVCMA
jgi:hypothetical protein